MFQIVTNGLIFFLLIFVSVYFVFIMKGLKALKERNHDRDFERLIQIMSESLKTKMDSNVEIIVAKSSEKALSQQRELQELISDKLNQVQKHSYEASEKQFKSFDTFRDKFLLELKQDFRQLNETIEKRLINISDRVNESLEEGLKKTRDTFTDVMKRLTRIDEAQKKIEQLSNNVVSLQDILTDKKSRGIWGEVQLNQILTSVFGESSKTYSVQHKLKSGHIVDAMLFLPEPTGMLPVDSKFPLENYKRMHNKQLPESERDLAAREFKKNVKKHVDDIASKYIVRGETGEQAIMFIPAEAIFSELHAYFSDVIDYANNKKVWITSPTTFMAVLSTIQVVMNNMERTKYADLIHQELNKLAIEFGRYQSRWDKLSVHIDTVSKDVKDIHTTTSKITDRFGKIANVELEQRDQTLT